MKTLAECLISQVSDSPIYSTNNDSEKEKFASSLLWRSVSCVDGHELNTETTYFFHDGSAIIESDKRFWCATSSNKSKLETGIFMQDLQHPFKSIIEEFDAKVIIKKSGLSLETNDFHLKVNQSNHYLVEYRSTKAIDALLSVRSDDGNFKELCYFTALDIRDAMQNAMQCIHNYKELIAKKACEKCLK